MLFALDAYARLLADEGEAARALALYTLIAKHPYVKESRLHQDQFERYLRPRVERLSTSEQAAARQRGEQGNVQAMVTKVLTALADSQGRLLPESATVLQATPNGT